MTTLSLLGGTWEYQFEDETVTTTFPTQPGTRMLKYISGGVISTNTLYSAVANAVDEFTAMGFKNPMLPVTPNAYTMESQAFISRASTEKLKEGTITADWSLVGSAGNNSGRGVLRIPYTGGTDFVSGDIGRRITDGTDEGTLLDYEVEPDGTKVAWVRPTDSTPSTGDIFDGSGSLTVVADGGTGASTSHTAATSGISQFTAIQAIGSVPTATEVYVVQDRFKLANAADNTGFQFWTTDPDVSLGIISVLIRTHNAAPSVAATDAIADGDLEVFARKYTALYDNFRLNVAAGGFSALPLSSAPDINNTTGYRSNLMTGSSGTWTVGNAVYVGASWAAATMKGVITAENAGKLEYYLIGDLTDLVGSESLKEYDFVAASDGDATATGAVGGSIPNLLGPTDTASGEGGSVTFTVGHTTRDHDNSGTAEPYSIIVDAKNNVPISKVYERIKYATRRGANETDLFGAGVNVPGETYRGLQALYYTNTHSASLTEGDDLIQSTGGNWTARLLSSNQAGAGEGAPGSYITVTDEQTSLEGLVDTDVVDDESSDQATIDTSPNASLSIASPKTSPLGTYTGTQIFGAPGVDFRNPASTDTQAYILTDDRLQLRTPPNIISFNVANTRALDKILVARDTGTAGVIDKDKYGGMDTPATTYNGLADYEVRVAGSITGDSPEVGVVRVVETTLQQEHRYYYGSRTVGANGVYSLIGDGVGSFAGTTTTGTTDTVLEDTGQTFQTAGVQVGMLIHFASLSSTYEVTAVTDEDTLAMQLLYGAGGAADSGETYTINALIQNYTTSDNLFDTILDYQEDVGTDGAPGTISNTLVKSGGDFGTVVQVRQGGLILPFEQNQNQGDGNTTVTTVRTPDSIVT